MQAINVVDCLLEVFSCLGVDAFEATLLNREETTLRFTRNYIHQNAHGQHSLLTVRVQNQGKLGEAFTSQLNAEGISTAVRKAQFIAKQSYAPEIPYPFTGQDEIFSRDLSDITTVGIDPGYMREHVEKTILTADQERFEASGIIASSSNVLGYISSQVEPVTCGFNDSWMNVLVVDNEKNRSGWSSKAACNSEDIDSEVLIKDALTKAKTKRTDRNIPHGAYKVILDHHAAAEVLAMLSDCCFAGSSFHGDGLVSAKNIGKQIFHSSLSLWDDAGDPEGCPMLFDFEGVAKQKVQLIDEGKIAGAVYDQATARQAGVQSTGHAISREKPFIVGPLAQNLFVQTGKQSLNEMIQWVNYGILISRFQYTTLVDPAGIVIAGTTRDGTLLIENGKIKAALPNLSFRVSILNLLRGEIGFDDNRLLMKTDSGFIATPRLYVDNFQII